MSQTTDQSLKNKVDALAQAVGQDTGKLPQIEERVETLEQTPHGDIVDSLPTDPEELAAFIAQYPHGAVILNRGEMSGSGSAEDFAVLEERLAAVESKNTEQDTAIQNAQTAVSNAGFPSGTQMLFAQSAAPTGWTKQTTVNDAAIRVVSGTTGGTASGTTAFSTMFNSSFNMSISGGNTGATTLTVAQMPSHNHNLTKASGYTNNSNTNAAAGGDTPAGRPTYTNTVDIIAKGGGGSHTHSLSGGSATVNLAVKYLDVIVCKKN